MFYVNLDGGIYRKSNQGIMGLNHGIYLIIKSGDFAASTGSVRTKLTQEATCGFDSSNVIPTLTTKTTTMQVSASADLIKSSPLLNEGEGN